MKILAAILTMLAMVLPSWSATVYPASTNGANVFTGTNTFTTKIIATNSTGGFIGNGGGMTNLMVTNIVYGPTTSTETNHLYVGGSDDLTVNGTYAWNGTAYSNGSALVYLDTGNYYISNSTDAQAFVSSGGIESPPDVYSQFNDVIHGAPTSVKFGTNTIYPAVFMASGSTITSTNPFVLPNLTANLSTSTNAGLSALDNTAYRAVLKGMMYSFPSNVNQALIQRVADKIARNENLNVLFHGNGLLDIVWTNIFSNILSTRSYSGRLYDGSGGYFPIYTGTADAIATPDTISFTPYYRLNANGDTIKFNSVNYNDGNLLTTAGNILQIVYVATNTAGHFAVYTNASAGTWAKAVTDVDASSGYGARVLSITNSTAIRWGWVLSNNVAGVNLFVAVGFYNTLTNGFSFEKMTLSSDVKNMDNASSLIRGPMLAAMRADIILISTLVNSADTPGSVTAINTVLNDLKTYATNSLPVYFSEWPLAATADRTAQCTFNEVVRTNAINNKSAYFDGFNVFGDYNTWTNRGFGAVDGVHATASGYDFAGNLVYTWLGLNKGGDYLTWNSPTNVVGTTATGQLPVNVNGRTYYIDLKE